MPDNDENLEDLGLIGHSYDALWNVRARIRAIGDWQLPTRRGVATDQLGIGLLTFVLAVITLGLVVRPLLTLLFGGVNVWVLAGWLLGLPVLAAWGISRPMPHHKTVSEFLISHLRAFLDDPVHVRGYPVQGSVEEFTGPQMHYQREFVLTEQVAAAEPGEESSTTPAWEARFTDPTDTLDEWVDGFITGQVTAHQSATTRPTVNPDARIGRRAAATTMEDPQ